MIDRKPWSAYDNLYDPDRVDIPLQALVNMAEYRREERAKACGGVDPLDIFTAYAQTEYLYNDDTSVLKAPPDFYKTATVDQRVNKFAKAYRDGAPLLLHRFLADIVISAAIYLHQRHGWRLRLYDGLRTVEGTYLLYQSAQDKWLEAGLLAKPGDSAHNRGMAIDSMMIDADGREVPVGARFDHVEMRINHRDYDGITAEEKEHRLIRERAFHYAAIENGTCIAPLRAEFWDDRFPGDDVDLWRVIESLCRCLGTQRPAEKDRAKEYDAFAEQWRELNHGGRMVQMFGDKAAKPPAYDRIIFHEKLNPIYSRDLPEGLRQVDESVELI